MKRGRPPLSVARRMKRFGVYISSIQEGKLKTYAGREGCGVSEIMRRAIAQYVEQQEAKGDDRRRNNKATSAR